MQPIPTEVLLFITDAGGGHRSAANALLAAAQERQWPWALRVVRLQDALGPHDLLRRLTGRSIEEHYNALVRRRWTIFLVPMLRVLHWVIARLHRPLVGTLARSLAGSRPAAVVSLMPNFNAVIRDAVRMAHRHVPFVVILTDYADFPPHFWMEPGIDRLIVGSEAAVAQARSLGILDSLTSRMSGMILHPRFYSAGSAGTRERVREELGVPAGAFLVLLLFGGKGSPEMLPLSRLLLARSDAWHVLAICGDNPRLLSRMAKLESSACGRIHSRGFTRRVAEDMAAADVLVTKPGPGTLAEAFHQRVPVIVPCNRYTVPQERHNAALIEGEGLGLVVRHWREIPHAVATLFADRGLREQIVLRIAALPENRAVYEALDIIGREIEARHGDTEAFPR